MQTITARPFMQVLNERLDIAKKQRLAQQQQEMQQEMQQKALAMQQKGFDQQQAKFDRDQVRYDDQEPMRALQQKMIEEQLRKAQNDPLSPGGKEFYDSEELRKKDPEAYERYLNTKVEKNPYKPQSDVGKLEEDHKYNLLQYGANDPRTLRSGKVLENKTKTDAERNAEKEKEKRKKDEMLFELETFSEQYLPIDRYFGGAWDSAETLWGDRSKYLNGSPEEKKVALNHMSKAWARLKASTDMTAEYLKSKNLATGQQIMLAHLQSFNQGVSPKLQYIIKSYLPAEVQREGLREYKRYRDLANKKANELTERINNPKKETVVAKETETITTPQGQEKVSATEKINQGGIQFDTEEEFTEYMKRLTPAQQQKVWDSYGL